MMNENSAYQSRYGAVFFMHTAAYGKMSKPNEMDMEKCYFR